MCDENLLKLLKLVGFQKILIQNVLTIFSKKKKKLLLLLLLFCRKFWTCKLFKKKKKKPCRAFLFEKSIGFSCKDLGKFSKSLFVFWKFLNLKLVENLVEFSSENFDILTKICICENMLGILGMILSCLLGIW